MSVSSPQPVTIVAVRGPFTNQEPWLSVAISGQSAICYVQIRRCGLVAFSSPCKQVLQAVLEGYPVQYVLSIGQRVIRAARNPDISKLHTLTSHTSQRVTSPHNFLSKKHNACLFGLYCTGYCPVLYCIVRARERFRFLLLSFYSYDSTL